MFDSILFRTDIYYIYNNAIFSWIFVSEWREIFNYSTMQIKLITNSWMSNSASSISAASSLTYAYLAEFMKPKIRPSIILWASCFVGVACALLPGKSKSNYVSAVHFICSSHLV